MMSKIDLNEMFEKAVVQAIVNAISPELTTQIAYQWKQNNGEKVTEEVLKDLDLRTIAKASAQAVLQDMNDTTTRWYGSESKATQFKREIKTMVKKEIAKMLAQKYVEENKEL